MFSKYLLNSQLLTLSGVGNNVYSMLSVGRNICQFLDSLILTFCLNNNFSYLAQSILFFFFFLYLTVRYSVLYELD